MNGSLRYTISEDPPDVEDEKEPMKTFARTLQLQRHSRTFEFFLATLVMLVLNRSAFGQTIQIKNISCQAEGCRGAQVIAATDASTVSILFNSFRVALADGLSRRPRDVMNSLINFSVVVPGGYSLELLSLDFRGFALLSTNAQGQIELKQTGRRKHGLLPDLNPVRNFNQATSGEFLQTFNLGPAFKSECGDQFDFKLHTKMTLSEKRNPGGRPLDPSEISLDSADLSAPSITYKTHLIRCR